MQGDAAKIRTWLKDQLARAGRGAKSRLAQHLGIRPEAVSRMISEDGEFRDLKASELVRIAVFFNTSPPILARGARGRPEPRPATDVPLLSWVSAGRLAETGDLPNPEAMIPVPDLAPGDYFALTVRGDSMDRVSPEGSVIVINRRERSPQRGKAYVFAVRGEATYKVWEPDPPRLEPFSTNPGNKPIYVGRKKDLFVVGRVRRTFMDL